jgi:hypothetical protein
MAGNTLHSAMTTAAMARVGAGDDETKAGYAALRLSVDVMITFLADVKVEIDQSESSGDLAFLQQTSAGLAGFLGNTTTFWKSEVRIGRLPAQGRRSSFVKFSSVLPRVSGRYRVGRGAAQQQQYRAGLRGARGAQGGTTGYLR